MHLFGVELTLNLSAGNEVNSSDGRCDVTKRARQRRSLIGQTVAARVKGDL